MMKKIFGAKKSTRCILVIIAISLLTFSYGIGVGLYHWPPFDILQYTKNDVLQFDESDVNEQKEITEISSFSPLVQALPEEKQYHVILMAGQSNMVGNGDVIDLSKDERILPANIFYYNFGLRPDLLHNFSRFGPEVSLAHHLYAKYPNKQFVLIKYAIGGSSLLDWAPDYSLENAKVTGHPEFGAMYQDFHRIVRDITGDRKTNLVGLLWMQGESDSKYELTGLGYYENFTEFVSRLRDDLGAPCLPVIIGQVNPPISRFPFVEAVRDAQSKASREYCNVEMITTEDLSKKNDDVHYDSNGQLLLGIRFARALSKYIEGIH
jgi:hypothetical protein